MRCTAGRHPPGRHVTRCVGGVDRAERLVLHIILVNRLLQLVLVEQEVKGTSTQRTQLTKNDVLRHTLHDGHTAGQRVERMAAAATGGVCRSAGAPQSTVPLESVQSQQKKMTTKSDMPSTQVLTAARSAASRLPCICSILFQPAWLGPAI